MTGLLPSIRITLHSAAPESLTLALWLDGKLQALLEFKRGKRNITLYADAGNGETFKARCSRGDDYCLELAIVELMRRLGLPGSAADLWSEVRKALERWDDIVEAARLSRLRGLLETYDKPVLTLQAGDFVVEVLASDGVEMPEYGGIVDLGGCIAVSETTFSYARIVGKSDFILSVEPIGFMVAYKREGSHLELAETATYAPRRQDSIKICGRPIRIRRSAAATSALGYPTLPEVETLSRALEEPRPLGRDAWRRTGEGILEELRKAVFFKDERLYYVVASYIVMTYFYDLFSAVPFLWFYGSYGSGKTRANMAVTMMSRRGVFIANPSNASLYRLTDALGATIGVDEGALPKEQKLILASSYKKGAVIPRAEPTKRGIILKLFSSVAPRVFSIADLPREDYLRQRIIPVLMVKGKPRMQEDPGPEDYAGLRAALYTLRLLGLPAAIEAKGLASRVLDRCGLWGREKEIWWPLLTAALLLGAEEPVLDYILEDIRARRESDEIYGAEKVVLAAIEEEFHIGETNLSGESVASFTASDLQWLIVTGKLREEDCLAIKDGPVEGETVKPECRKRDEELRREWSPQRIGRILERMGLSKYKKKIGKGSSARWVYRVPWSAFEEKARLYGYLGSVESVKSAECLGEIYSKGAGQGTHPETIAEYSEPLNEAAGSGRGISLENFTDSTDSTDQARDEVF